MSGLEAWVGSCWGRALPASVLRSSSGGLAVSPTQLRHFRANQPPVQFRVLAGPWALEPARAVEVRRGGTWHLQAPPSSPGPRGAALPPGSLSPQPTATASRGQGDMTNLFPGPPRRVVGGGCHSTIWGPDRIPRAVPALMGGWVPWVLLGQKAWAAAVGIPGLQVQCRPRGGGTAVCRFTLGGPEGRELRVGFL